MRSTARTLHKYLSLTFAVLWFLQAFTGTLLVFRGELDDLGVGGSTGSLDIAALGRGMDALAMRHPGSHVEQLKASGGATNHFDVNLTDGAGRTTVFGMDAAGRILRSRPLNYDFPAPGILQIASLFHDELFMGDTGLIFLGISGLLLLTNIGLGLRSAWPRRGQWTRWLLPAAQRIPAMKVLTLHRAAALWLCVPAIVLISMGTAMAWQSQIEDLLGVTHHLPPLAQPTLGSPTTAVEAMRTAISLYPHAALAELRMPHKHAPWYRVRLRQPGEARRVAGTTTIYVSAYGNRVLENDNALTETPQSRFVTDLYPLHTGEILGLGGRIVSLLVGLWVMTVSSLGITLWWTRHRAH